jgi:hypothetical protein
MSLFLSDWLQEEIRGGESLGTVPVRRPPPVPVRLPPPPPPQPVQSPRRKAHLSLSSDYFSLKYGDCWPGMTLSHFQNVESFFIASRCDTQQIGGVSSASIQSHVYMHVDMYIHISMTRNTHKVRYVNSHAQRKYVTNAYISYAYIHMQACIYIRMYLLCIQIYTRMHVY